MISRKKYVPAEGWSSYNERLVRRGEFYFDLAFLESLPEELSRQNAGKRGRPFAYADSFIQFACVVYHVFRLPYRQMEGFLRKLGVLVPALQAPDYSTPCRRFQTLHLQLPVLDLEEPVVVAVDSTGVKVTNRGEWMREKHGHRRRGWIKVHIAVNVKTKQLLSLELSDENTHDSSKLRPLLDRIPHLKDVLGDGGYDTYDNFQYLMTDRGLPAPGIKLREDASRKGLTDRAFAVREHQQIGHDAWKKQHQYGQRWTSEGYFSGEKRTFGETVRATSIEGMWREVKTKFFLYNLLLTI